MKKCEPPVTVLENNNNQRPKPTEVHITEFLQPILMPVKGTPDIVLSIDPKAPNELFVFLGLALLEKVPRARKHLAFKLLLARLSNAGGHSRRLTRTFGVARSTLRRWGGALKSGDMERVRKAFSGQGHERKITPEIENYVRDRFHDLHGQCRTHNKVIRAEVLKYFKVSISAERLRWIFKEERGPLAHPPKSDNGQPEKNGSESKPAEPCLGANPCETSLETIAGECFLPLTRNHSLPPSGLLWSGCVVPQKPTLCHHAGLLLMSHWIDTLMAGWTLLPDLVRQWVGQVLLGAVNHEQSKRLSFSSLASIIGPAIRSVNYQRRLLKKLAEPDKVLDLLKRNGQLLGLSEKSLFYFDPHVEEYTGVLKTLKGWSGGLHRVDKIINMDFIHTEDGEPCFVQHADNFYDMRVRFFMCIKAFRGILDPVKRSLTWVADRGLYGLQTLLRIVDEYKDHFITWEKDYAQNGWDEKATVQHFDSLKPRNHAEDLCCYRFSWQEHPWAREPRFQRLIVRAINPSGREIEVAVLTSDPARARQGVIQALFNRWVQENDFGYMDRHVGINELTSRAHDSYASLRGKLDDRQVQSRAYRALRKELILAESAFTRRLLKREKLSQSHAAQADLERTAREGLNRQIQTLTERPEEVAEARNLKKHRKALDRLVAKQAAHSANRQKEQEDLDRLIDDQRHEVAKAKECLAESVREESRLQALIDEQYFRLDTRRKAFMDAIRLSCRNLFCKLALEFRSLYNNYRDDHVIVRELTRSAGIIQQREGVAHILLIPSMEFQPATRIIVQGFLAKISQQINQHFGSRYMPIQIQLLNDKSNDLTIDQHGLRWVSSPP